MYTCTTQLIHIAPWPMYMLDWLIHICDMTHWYVQHDSLICAPWLIDICNMTHWYVRHDSLIRATWLIDRQHDSFICATRRVHMCDMTHSHVRHDSVIPNQCPLPSCYHPPFQVHNIHIYIHTYIKCDDILITHSCLINNSGLHTTIHLFFKYMFTCIHTKICTFILTDIYTSVTTYTWLIHASSKPVAFVLLCTFSSTCLQTCTPTHMNTFIHTDTHINVTTYTCLHIHTHIHKTNIRTKIHMWRHTHH